jgi:exopolyphosphatase / guanosine-5'-triphosphate,3'-diphosphate pyrophosphatase
MAILERRQVEAEPARLGVAAAIDIGSYSVHLLVAEITPDELRARHDESAFLGLGRTIDEGGRLGAARETLVETLAGFAARAAALGAESLTIVGTDPLRRAPDAGDAIAEIRAAVGTSVTILSHEEEAFLALLGVQEGRRLARDTVMVDVGGGSTEILIATPDQAPVAMGLPLGAARLTGVHVRNDPPTKAELAALDAEVAAAMRFAPPFAPEQLVAVGGTARSLLRIGPPLANRVLTQSRIRNALDLLSTKPSALIAERNGVRLSRARVLPAGATILAAALDRYGLDRLRVASGGLREGLILAAHHAGDAWRGELRELARGWLD